MNLLARTPPLSQGDGVRRAFDRLAAAIESIPGPSQPSRAEAVKLMRARDFDIWISLIREDATAAAARETLAIATGTLELAAAGPYSQPTVKERVATLKRSVDHIASDGLLRDQRGEVLNALRDALAVLMAIRAASPAVVGAQSSAS
jgi:hypothetical protein